MDDLEELENAIAVIGLSGRFPGANNTESFWKNLSSGIDSISKFSDAWLTKNNIPETELKNPSYVKSRGILENVEYFDADFFGFSPKEAEITDPQHRLFLELAWDALENSGYCSEKYTGSIGVYGSCGSNSYFINNIYPNHDLRKQLSEQILYIGNERDFLSTRTSYKLNLKGPSLNVQTACSSSLVAICLACDHLLTFQCDMALAGGVSITLPQESGYHYQEGMIFSPEGCCRPFDAKANGTVPGNGGGMVVLKRLQDALHDKDHIYAIIRGYGVSNDGVDKVSFAAPSISGQTETIISAIEMSSIDPETISYIETHGTGTLLGDPIEIQALTQAFGNYTDKKNFCAIGSVKSNVGHLIEAAGVTSFIKTVLSLHHHTILPSLHFDSPNPNIDFQNSPFFVNTSLKKWETNVSPLRAGVSSFGMGGTNAHMILEEAPPHKTTQSTRPCQLVTLSARTPTALKSSAAKFDSAFENGSIPSLADLSYTLRMGRKDFDHRIYKVVKNFDQNPSLISLIDTDSYSYPSEINTQRNASIVFMMTGQGSQYINMAKGLYHTEPSFKKWIDQCAKIFKSTTSLDLLEILYPDQENIEQAKAKLNQTSITQPTLFVIEYALSKLWEEWGISPDVMIGHSIGEYVVACLASVFSLEDAIKLVSLRGKLMQKTAPGKMLAVPLSEEEIQPYLSNSVSLAAVNHSTGCVLSGPPDEIESINNELIAKEINGKFLNTNYAFHSSSVEEILPEFEEAFDQIELTPPKIPFISNFTGTWIDAEEVTTPTYWANHMRHTVQFSKGINELLQQPDRIFIEIGPGSILTRLVQRHLGVDSHSIALSSLPYKGTDEDTEVLFNSLGQLWLRDLPIDWPGVFKNESPSRIPLPSYPFERKKYWINPPNAKASFVSEKSENSKSKTPSKSHTKNDSISSKNQTIEETLVDIWKDYLGYETVKTTDDFFRLGGDSLLSIQLLNKIEKVFGVKLSVQTLLEAPTIAQLAKIIHEKSTQPTFSNKETTTNTQLVKLKSGDLRTPLFFIHPIEGQVFCYKSLVDSLKYDGPIFGIQSAEFSNKKELPFESIEQLASQHIEIVKQSQSNPPYRFLGTSFGGLIAYEMARQLNDSYQAVDFLAMLDVIPPDDALKKATDDTEILRLLLELFERKHFSIEDLKSLSEKEKINRLMKALNLDNWPLKEQKRIFNCIKNNWRALRKYDVKAYPEKVIFFQAKKKNINNEIDLGNLWKQFAQKIEIYEIEGDHLSIIHQPHVQNLARILETEVNKLDRQSP